MNSVMATVVALALDALLGEPRRAHPLVGFGQLAPLVETWLRGAVGADAPCQRWQGALAVVLLLAPPVSIVWAISTWSAVTPLVGVVTLYLALGARSLAAHATSVRRALEAEDLTLARIQVGRIVSRDTGELTASQIAAAAVESVLENGNDAVFGALFWFLVAGAPGVVTYRLANTLDAMWGYRTPRYRDFGWAAARLDDLLNLIPARLTAVTYALVGQFGCALSCWRSQAPLWESPNAGPVMAAGAGGLQVRLGGPARYHGSWRPRPGLGCGRSPLPDDIRRAVSLVGRGVVLWLLAIVLVVGVRPYA